MKFFKFFFVFFILIFYRTSFALIPSPEEVVVPLKELPHAKINFNFAQVNLPNSDKFEVKLKYEPEDNFDKIQCNNNYQYFSGSNWKSFNINQDSFKLNYLCYQRLVFVAKESFIHDPVDLYDAKGAILDNIKIANYLTYSYKLPDVKTPGLEKVLHKSFSLYFTSFIEKKSDTENIYSLVDINYASSNNYGDFRQKINMGKLIFTAIIHSGKGQKKEYNIGNIEISTPDDYIYYNGSKNRKDMLPTLKFNYGNSQEKIKLNTQKNVGVLSNVKLYASVSKNKPFAVDPNPNPTINIMLLCSQPKGDQICSGDNLDESCYIKCNPTNLPEIK